MRSKKNQKIYKKIFYKRQDSKIYFVYEKPNSQNYVRLISFYLSKKLPFKNPKIVKLAKAIISIHHGTHGGIFIPFCNSYLKFSLTVNIMIHLVFIIMRNQKIFESFPTKCILLIFIYLFIT